MSASDTADAAYDEMMLMEAHDRGDHVLRHRACPSCPDVPSFENYKPGVYIVSLREDGFLVVEVKEDGSVWDPLMDAPNYGHGDLYDILTDIIDRQDEAYEKAAGELDPAIDEEDPL